MNGTCINYIGPSDDTAYAACMQAKAQVEAAQIQAAADGGALVWQVAFFVALAVIVALAVLVVRQRRAVAS